MFIKNGVEGREVQENSLKQERKVREDEGFSWIPWRTTLEDEDLSVERCYWLLIFVGLERGRESLIVVRVECERERESEWEVEV